MLQEKLRELARLYVDLEEARGDVGMAQRALESSYQYANLQESKLKQLELEEQAIALRSEINDLTLGAYYKTGTKHPAPGVGVRVGTELIYDPVDAKTYCLSELPEALKLDANVFEKYANGIREVKPLDFVSFAEKATPTISRDLGEYLE